MKRRTPAFNVLLVHVLLVLVLLVLVLTGLVMSIPMKGKESPFKPELHDDEKRSVESEEEVNNNEDLNLYEGDIVLDVEDEELVDLRDAGDVDGPLNTVKRNAMRNRYSLWLTKIVPYLIDGSSIATYSKTYNAIQQAISNYNQQTCISWRPRHLHSTWHYVKFVKKPGCWSRVGRVPYSTGFQEISIGPGCESIGTVMHEMMHALGFWHAQSRPDRNQAVEILWENIIEGKEHNFNKYNHEQTDVLGLPYDFDSVMHYSNKAFTKNGKNTIQKIGDPTASFGQRIGFSNNDKLQFYKLYSCGTAYGGWSLWSTFTPCDSSCKKKRMRFYTGGVQTQEVYCTSQECYKPVEGHWGRWSAWGSCSKTCDFGVKSRYRLCDDPTPKYGGAACSGQSTQSQNCLVFFCNAGPDDCQFENPSKPYCDWTQDTNDNNQKYFPDWIRISGSTPSPGTGPTGDHTIGTGYYIYGEASQCSAGQVVRLLSKEYQPTNGRCMTFWYNMYGEAMGALNIYVQPKGASGKKIFTKSGNQGTKWMNGKALIQSSYNYKLVLEMVCGSSYQGDIAVDDITFQNRAC